MTRKRQHIRKNRSKAATTARRQRLRRAAARLMAVAAAGLGIPLLALGCILGHDLITQGAYYRIDETALSGNARLSRETVLRQAAIPPALNLLGVNLGRIRSRLLAHPWIAEASVARHFPHRLEIRIREEQPLAQLGMDDQWFLANTGGRLFVVLDEPAPGIPRVTGVTFADLDADGRVPAALWRTVTTALSHFGEGRTAAIGPIAYDRDTGVRIQGVPGLDTIIVGIPTPPGAFDTAQRIAARLADSGRATGVAAIDMRNPRRVVVVPSPTGTHANQINEESKHAA